MRVKVFLSIACFLFAVGLGSYRMLSSWEGLIYVSLGPLGSNRVPAAIPKRLDFSGLVGAELITASQKRLITAAKVIQRDQQIGIELGHFLTRGDDGKRQLACDYYQRLTLRFAAEGLAEGGSKPEMEIDSPCRPASDISRIEPIWIPVGKLRKERPASMDLTYQEFEDVRFRFDNMSSQWAQNWSLQSVQLYRDSGRRIEISSTELSELMPRPLIISWPSVQ